MSPEERSSMMHSLVGRWQESGMTQVQFAEENHVSIHTLKYWLYKIRKSGISSGGFIHLKTFSSPAEYMIRYPNGVELRISSAIPISVVRSLVNL
jgi:hypothetical protein